MTTRKTLADYPAAYQEQIGRQLHGSTPAIPATPRPELPPVGGKATPRLRQASKGPNRWEAEFAAKLRAEHPKATVFEQAVTLVLANGLRYTPDVFIPTFPGHIAAPTFYEVKGFMRSTGAAKVKMAARVHSWATFYLVTKQRKRDGGGWRIERVLP